MKKPTQLLFGGIAAALAIVATGYLGEQRSKSQVYELVAQCETEHTRTPESAKEPWRQGQLICEPASLRQLSNQSRLVGIQAKIVDTERNGESWFKGALILAFIVAPFLAIPYFWYFLLRRTRELRDAVVGKDMEQNQAPSTVVAEPTDMPAMLGSMLRDIKNGWIAAVISGSITLIFTAVSTLGTSVYNFSAWELLDVALTFSLAYGIYRRSRVCAALLLLYFIQAKIFLLQAGAPASSIPVALIFLYFFSRAALGIFRYHKRGIRA